MSDSESNAVKLARIEATQEERFKTLFDQLERNNPHPLVQKALDKIDALDEKVGVRFKMIEEAAQADSDELKALKNKGAGVLTAVGVAFTMAATFFSDILVQLKSFLTA